MGIKRKLRIMRAERMKIDVNKKGGFTKFAEMMREEIKLRNKLRR